MIAAEDTTLLLLAAGKSQRFGAGTSKLDMPVGELPLGLHVARALSATPFARRVAIVNRSRIDYAAEGFAVISNDDPLADMASSLRLGVAAAGDTAGLLVVLADMPRITAAHVRQLLDAAEGDAAIVAASDGAIPRPPALFGRAHFAHLGTIIGERGARDLIRAGKHVRMPPADLIDIDTPLDLAAVQHRG